MKKIVNNLSIILFVTGITLILVSWLLEITDLYKLLIPVGFVIVLFGLFVDFKYVEEKRSDLIDELDDEEQTQVDDYLRSEQFAKDFKELVKKDTWDRGLPMAYMNDKKQLVHHWKDGRIEVIKDLSNEDNIR